MNVRWWVLVLTVLTLASGPALSDERDDEDTEGNIGKLLSEARIPVEEALEAALATQPGRAVEVELEGEMVDGRLDGTYSVEIVDGSGAFHQVTVDAVSGEVRSREIEDDEGDAKEQRSVVRALAQASHDLPACLRAVAAEKRGAVLSAAIAYDDGVPRCEAIAVDGERLYEVEIDLRDGSLIEVERARRLEDGDDDRDDDEEGDEGE